MFDHTSLIKTEGNVLNFDDSFVGETREFNVLIKNYEVAVSVKGTRYVTGTIQNGSVTCGFKIWDAVLVSSFETAAPVGKAMKVTGKAADYKGTHEWHIVNFTGEPTSDISSVMPCVPDLDGLWKAFCDRIAELPTEWQVTLNYIFHGVDDKDMLTLFKNCWGGAKIHDARCGGALAHTMKMLNIFDTLVKNDPRLEEISPIMKTAIIVHDLGKCEEMINGVYQANSFVPHTQRIAAYMGRWQKEITAQIGEDNYYRLMSAVLGHHGGLGGDAAPRSIYAYILHLIDMLESQTTAIFDQLDNGTNLKMSSSGDCTVWHNEFTLYV
jgi:3'-5' exoribonuclease